ncbi:MAG: NAD(P)H-hydrate dehydratase [Panacagrimonas sp.]
MNVLAGHAHRPRLYSAAQARELDRRFSRECDVPSYTLMQCAAQAAFDALRRRWPQARRIAVLCGSGNNGGDGYEVAALAVDAGMTVDIAHVGALPTGGDAVTAQSSWARQHGPAAEFSEEWARDVLPKAEVICDAIFGIGITREVSGLAAAAIKAINARRSEQAVLALDLPSGLDADSGTVQGCAVRADLTVSFIVRKLGPYTGAGPDYAGHRELADLQIPTALVESSPALAMLMRCEDLVAALPPRPRSAHKGAHGQVLLVGGDAGMAGAILLAVRGALRTGAGLVSAVTRPAHALPLTAAQPEAMFHGVDSAASIDELLRKSDVVAVGPGLGQSVWSAGLLDRCLRAGRPLVLDADALNLLTRTPTIRLPPDSVITPHPGEAARLLNTDTATIQRDRLAAARALRQRFGTVVVLKGAGTLVCGEQVQVCPFGNPGMGVGGMGDVLTGVIAALIGQGLSPEQAAAHGVLAHALAGDRAAADGERGMVPSDLIEHLRLLVNPKWS